MNNDNTPALDWPWQIPQTLALRAADAQVAHALESGDPSVWQDMQQQRTAELLTHAMSTISWWRDRLGFRPTAPILDDWAGQAVLNLASLRESIHPTQAPRLPDAHGAMQAVQISISAEESVSLRVSDLSQRLANHVHHADHATQGRDPRRLRANLSERSPTHKGKHSTQTGFEALGEAAVYSRHTAHGASVGSDGQSQIDWSGHLAWLRDFKPSYLAIHPRDLGALLDALERESNLRAAATAGSAQAAAPSIAIEQILSYGATVTAALRLRAKTLLGASIRDRYVCDEAGPVAFQCPHSDAYLHVAVATTRVDVLRDDDSPTEPGESGRVVVTMLYQWATPVIRYDTLDRAAWHANCPGCGATVPALSQLVRRA
jgi:phenylacetate-CoA ligase